MDYFVQVRMPGQPAGTYFGGKMEESVSYGRDGSDRSANGEAMWQSRQGWEDARVTGVTSKCQRPLTHGASHILVSRVSRTVGQMGG